MKEKTKRTKTNKPICSKNNNKHVGAERIGTRPNPYNKGITLVALIITIVILLILAAVAINAVKGDGIISHAKNAKTDYTKAQANEQALLKEYEKDIEDGITGGKKEEQQNIEITVGGQKVKLTENNAKDYLGKVVTNYTGATSVTIAGKDYTVSPAYRLYYVDFGNKYGDGAGTIYLKADCTSNNYSLPITDTTVATEPNIKIKNLNPELYKSGATAPTATNSNMKAVTWLTNTTNWEGLKTSDATLANKVNYIVGAPSLEMMMDSYNTHYGLTGDTPDYSAITAGTRRKLFYKYTTGTSGYQVGPCANNSAEYDYYTSDNSVYTDSAIDSMYYPGANQFYWLASPSASDTGSVMYVRYFSGGNVNSNDCIIYYALCPLVSLQSSVNLTLAE